MYTGALENYPELVDQMAWIAPLWGNPGDVLNEVRSPWILADTLRDHGFLFPETRSTDDGLPRDGSWLVKTYRGASGSGVRALIPEFSEIAPSACYQQRIAGVPYAAVFMGYVEGASILGLTRQLVGESWLGAHEFQYSGSIGPYWVADAALSEVRRIGRELANRFSLLGLFGIDFMIDEEKVWTLEVNPRFTASVEIIERAGAWTSIVAHAMACGGMNLADSLNLQKENRPLQPAIHAPQSAQPHGVHGKAIVFAKRRVIISEGFAEWALGESLAEPWPMLADVSPAGTPIAPGRPVITVFAARESVDEVELQLRQRVAEVEAKLYAE
jgi:predicted ATP-grasp superfamily ATP-dependent carboligase